jgi:hypothetical protein
MDPEEFFSRPQIFSAGFANPFRISSVSGKTAHSQRGRATRSIFIPVYKGSYLC